MKVATVHNISSRPPPLPTILCDRGGLDIHDAAIESTRVTVSVPHDAFIEPTAVCPYVALDVDNDGAIDAADEIIDGGSLGLYLVPKTWYESKSDRLRELVTSNVPVPGFGLAKSLFLAFVSDSAPPGASQEKTYRTAAQLRPLMGTANTNSGLEVCVDGRCGGDPTNDGLIAVRTWRFAEDSPLVQAIVGSDAFKIGLSNSIKDLCTLPHGDYPASSGLLQLRGNVDATRIQFSPLNLELDLYNAIGAANIRGSVSIGRFSRRINVLGQEVVDISEVQLVDAAIEDYLDFYVYDQYPPLLLPWLNRVRMVDIQAGFLGDGFSGGVRWEVFKLPPSLGPHVLPCW